MKRREFLATAAALTLPLSARLSLAAEAGKPEQFIEVRTYHFATPQKKQAFSKFLAEAGIAAMNRAGVQPVGAFELHAKDNPTLKLSEDSNDLYLVLPHATAETAFNLAAKLDADRELQEKGKDLLKSAKSDPAFTRYESTLLVPFEMFKSVQAPPPAPGRLVQLRTYESHSEERAVTKLRMFQQGGELGIFKQVGIPAVFFGRAVAGPNLPSLTYMVAFENEQAQEKGWAGFKDNADWKKLSKEPEYKDAVSKVTNLVLRPIAGSQI